MAADRGAGPGARPADPAGAWPSGCATCVLLNPAAGRAGPDASLRRALDGLPDAAVRAPADAAGTERLVRAAQEAGCRRLVVAGGDGTLHRVVSALRRPADGPVVGIVPAGTGNDFARALDLPADPAAAAELAARAPPRPVDLMAFRVGGREGTAVNFLLGGAGGDVARHVTPRRKRRWRRLVYLRAAAEELRSVRPRELEVRADGATVSSGAHLAVLVANGPTLGRGLPAAPRAAVDDGRLDLVAVRGASAADLAGTLARMLAGRHLQSRRVTWRRAGRISVRGAEQTPFNADGEAVGGGDATVRVLPSALLVAAPGPGGQRSAGPRPSNG